MALIPTEIINELNLLKLQQQKLQDLNRKLACALVEARDVMVANGIGIDSITLKGINDLIKEVPA